MSELADLLRYAFNEFSIIVLLVILVRLWFLRTSDDYTTLREVRLAGVNLRNFFASSSLRNCVVGKTVESCLHALKNLDLKSRGYQACGIKTVFRKSVNGFMLPDCVSRLMVSQFLLSREISMLALSCTVWYEFGLDEFCSLKPDRQLAGIFLRV